MNSAPPISALLGQQYTPKRLEEHPAVPVLQQFMHDQLNPNTYALLMSMLHDHVTMLPMLHPRSLLQQPLELQCQALGETAQIIESCQLTQCSRSPLHWLVYLCPTTHALKVLIVPVMDVLLATLPGFEAFEASHMYANDHIMVDRTGNHLEFTRTYGVTEATPSARCGGFAMIRVEGIQYFTYMSEHELNSAQQAYATIIGDACDYPLLDEVILTMRTIKHMGTVAFYDPRTDYLCRFTQHIADLFQHAKPAQVTQGHQGNRGHHSNNQGAPRTQQPPCRTTALLNGLT